MSQMESSIGVGGALGARVIRAPRAPLAWRLRNSLNVSYLWALFANWLAAWFTRFFGVPTIVSDLRARKIRADGSIVDFGVVCRRLVTQNGVGFIVDDWDDDTTDITNMNYHASGTGTTAAANDDTALETESTAITDREAGAKTQPAYNQLQTVATQSYTGSGAITEHGLLSVVTEGSGVLWDRHTFSAINVANGDSIEWTYTVTFSPET